MQWIVFNRLPVVGCVSYFQFSTVLGCAIVKVCICPFLFIPQIVSLGQTPRSGICWARMHMFLRFSVHLAKLLSRKVMQLSCSLTRSVWERVSFFITFPKGSLEDAEGKRESLVPSDPRAGSQPVHFFFQAVIGRLFSKTGQGWLVLWTARGSEPAYGKEQPVRG